MGARRRQRGDGPARHPAAGRADAPPASVRLRAAQVIDEQRDKMFANLAATVAGRDPEGVHDMRVASRRMRACLKLFARWLDADDLGRVAPPVRRLTRALGGVRELDVLRSSLAGLTARASAERALAIECVDARLARRRRRARERMMASFGRVGLDRLERRLRRMTAQLERHALRPAGPALEDGTIGATAPAAPSGTAPAAAPGAADPGAVPEDQPIVALLGPMAGTLLAEAHEVCHPALPDETGARAAAEALHATRIAAKKLRYALEIVAPYLGDAGGDAVRRLRALQDKLGDFHDDTVLDDVLRAEIERVAERERPLLTRELKRLRAARRRVLTRDERGVRRAIVALRDSGFVELVAHALRAAGVAVEGPAVEAPADAGDDPSPPAPARDAPRRRTVARTPSAMPTERRPRAAREPRKPRAATAAAGATAGPSGEPGPQ